jgi:hypothetical protein
MHKPKDAGARSETFGQALSKQAEYLYGKEGSSKRLATDLLFLGSPYDGTCRLLHDRIRIKSECPADMDAQLEEASRQNMIRALQNPRSDFFRQITQIGTALENRNYKFFDRISAGIKQLRSDDDIRLEDLIAQVYQAWMCASAWSWVAEWSLPDFKDYVADGIEPTMPQMKQLVKRLWAIKKLKMWVYFTEQQSADVEKQIDEEITTWREPEWKRLWIRTGLKLKRARPGPKPGTK